MTRPHRLACTLAALLLAGAAHAQGGAAGVMTVEVFANSAMLVTPEPSPALPYQLKVYRLDAMRNIEAAINQNLPQTEAEAQQWIAANEARIRRQVQPQVESAAQGLTLAANYRLSRVPAIVINRKTVVYGITDVQQALELARRQPGGKP